MSQGLKNILHNTVLLNFSVNKMARYISNRLLAEVTKHTKTQGAPLYRKKDEDLSVTQKGSVKKLEELLNFRPFIAKRVVLKYKKFSKLTSCNIMENYFSCINNGITKETLAKFPEVLAELDILLKLKELKKLPYDINAVTPLLSITYNNLKKLAEQEIDTRRIMHISKLLEIDECEVCKQFVQKTFLLSLKLSQLESNIKLLSDFGITKEEIIRDLWVLKYSDELIRKRLLLAKENNIETIKTWMVRAQPQIFEKYIKRRSDTKSILGNSSLAQYLSERLECTEELAKYIIAKQPALKNKSLKKMNEMIDFLLKYGFQSTHIRRVPKILLHSVETTKKRLKELEAQGMQLEALYLLTKSQKQYMQYYETFIKTKNKLKN